MERGGGRSPEERAAAAEERERARVADEQGVPLEDEGADERGEGGWSGPDLGSISRYGGGVDVYTRRRVIAGAVVVAVILALFLLLVGC